MLEDYASAVTQAIDQYSQQKDLQPFDGVVDIISLRSPNRLEALFMGVRGTAKSTYRDTLYHSGLYKRGLALFWIAVVLMAYLT
jgi:hypothetical protein